VEEIKNWHGKQKEGVSNKRLRPSPNLLDTSMDKKAARGRFNGSVSTVIYQRNMRKHGKTLTCKKWLDLHTYVWCHYIHELFEHKKFSCLKLLY
jgi:hypothetical protein